MKKHLIYAICVSWIIAQAPPGYYSSADGLESEALRLALHQIIDNHQAQSYSSLWTHVQSTDDKPNGKVWDMYSDIPGGTPPYEYTFGSDQCGNYNSENDCYNREHSWPKSWANDTYPMNTDLFHIYPTDGYVNGRRSNYPFGEVNNPTWTSMNGSKLGPNVTSGYTGVVFEPIDGYKGDFARSYFYMSTRYHTEDSSWDETPMTDGADIKPWAVSLLLDWHHDDPVSQKETDRNNAVFAIQQNRNPFIDHPEWADCIWSGNCDLSTEVITPEYISLLKNYPNPFNPVTTIQLTVKTNEFGSLKIYDISGKLTEILFEDEWISGTNEFVWNADGVSSGIYFIQFVFNDKIESKKILLLK